MSVVINIFIGVFTWLVGKFSEYVARKVAIVGAAIAVFTTLTIAFYAALSLVLHSISGTLPSYSGVEMAFYVACPPALPLAIAAVISAKTVAALYQINLRIVTYTATAG